MKIYIKAMSIKKDEAIRHLSSLSDTVMEHLIKLLIYSGSRPNDVRGWTKTVARCIYRADNITLKPNGKKLKQNDIMTSLFKCMGDELHDYELILEAFREDNKHGKFNYDDKTSYPDFAVTRELAVGLMTLCYDVVDLTIPLLLDKNEHLLSEYEQVVQTALDGF